MVSYRDILRAVAALAIGLAGLGGATAHAQARLADTPKEAAVSCFHATAVVKLKSAPSQTHAAAEGTWYLLEYLRADGPAGNTMKQAEELAATPFPDQSFDALAPELLKGCAARYPRNDDARAIALPADPFERDMLCLPVTSMLLGMAQVESEQTGKSVLQVPLKTLNDLLLDRNTDDRLAGKGYPTEAAVVALFNEKLRLVPSYGGLIGVFRACERAG